MIDPPVQNWLSDSLWKQVRDSVPIGCVDVVPVRLDVKSSIGEVGLIYRDTPHQDRRWCVVGGRLLRDESVAEAITRQLRDTLGQAVQFQLDTDPQPDFVVSYFSQPRAIGLYDPRQHALTLNYIVPIDGPIVPGGEAIDFRWFKIDQLPSPDEFGFGQDHVVRECVASWNRR